MSSKLQFDNLHEDLQNEITKNLFKFPDSPVSFGEFFEMNDLNNVRWTGCTFTLTGDPSDPEYNKRTLYIDHLGDRYNYPYQHKDKNKLNLYNFNLFDSVDKDATKKFDFINSKMHYRNREKPDCSDRFFDTTCTPTRYQIITKIEIKKNGQPILTAQKILGGGRKEYVKKDVKKEILGKLRCIYKIHGSRKEHVKYKGMFITVSDYKNLMR